MKIIFVLIFLTVTLTIMGHEFVRVNRTDSLAKGYVAGNITSLTFSDFANFELKVTKIWSW